MITYREHLHLFYDGVIPRRERDLARGITPTTHLRFNIGQSRSRVRGYIKRIRMGQDYRSMLTAELAYLDGLRRKLGEAS